MIATGTHRAQTPEEDILVLGEEMVKRLRVHQHDCRNKENLVYKGTTSRGNRVYINKVVAGADKIIATGAVTLHPMAGFGGGRKAIVPGVAGLETINCNHVLALAEKNGDGCNPDVTTAKLEGNPFHEDLMECVDFVDPDFLFDVVLTSDGELYEVVAGNWKTAFYKGCQDLLEYIGQIRIIHVDSGDIDRHRQRDAKPFLPFSDFGCRLTPDIVIQLLDQSVLLKKRDKDPRTDHPELGMLPSDQRLRTA